MGFASSTAKTRAALTALSVFIAAVVMAISCLAFLPMQAGAAQDDSAQEQVVKVGYYESRAFQEGASEGSIKDGFGYEYLQRVAAYAGWRYEYVYGTWSDLYAKLESGQIDMLGGVAKTEGRARSVLFPSASMLNETFYLYESNSAIAEDVANCKRIGVIANSSAVKVLKQWIADNDDERVVVTFESKGSLSKALKRGEVDAFVSSDNVTYDIKGIAPVQIIGKEPYYLAVSGKRHDLLKSVNDAQTIISTQDRLFIDKLSSKYTVDTSVNKYLTRKEVNWMSEHDHLRVGYANCYLPYCDTDASGSPTGLMVDVLNEILDKLPGNWDPSIDYVAFDDQHDLYDALKNGQVDIAFPVGGQTWYSEQKGYLRSSPVTTPTVDLIYLGSSNYAEATQTIAVNTNNVLQQNYVHLCYPNAQIAYFNSIEDCLKAIKSGKAGSTVVNGLRAGSLLNNQPNLVALQLPDSDDRCFGVRADESVLLQVLNRGLGIIGSDYGTNASYLYMEGLYQYSLEDLARDYWPFILAVVLAVALALLAWGVRRYNKLQTEREHEARQNKLLEEALETAEKASAAKDTLLGNLSHDIRTPLNGILGVIDVNMSVDDPSVREENARKAHRAADQLLAIVDDLLEMSKLKSGEVEVVCEPVDIGAVVESCVDDISELAAARNVNVTLQTKGLPLHRLRVMTSPTYLRRVIVNIVDNAIRYNKDGGSVVVCVAADRLDDANTRISLKVTDTGRGMSQEQLAKVFEPFYQGHRGARSVYPGSGLGMPIVKEIVTLLGGTISVKSTEDVGTDIAVEFAFALAKDGEAAHEETEEREYRGIDGLRILIAEDNELNVEITKYALEQNGVEVVVARDGVEAVTRFAESPQGYFNAIIMDIMMPNMDGINATRAIRTMARMDAATIPIIAITANIFEDDKANVLNAGMNAHLHKPLDVEELVRTIARLCS